MMHYSLLPQFSMSRVYTLTVMVTLLSRTSLRAILDSTGHASFATTIRDATRNPTHGGIMVSRLFSRIFILLSWFCTGWG